jgi:hypothetical protein
MAKAPAALSTTKATPAKTRAAAIVKKKKK